MGKMERESLRARRRGYVKDAVLLTLGTAGIMAVAMIAPNTLQLLGKFGIGGKRLGDQSRTALSRLKSAGLIEFIEKNGRKFARITPQGKRALEKYQMRALAAARTHKRWDKKYRVVIFDIPERKRGIRHALRRQMKETGFLQLQQSVWVFPYDCEDLIALIKANLHLGKNVIYMIVENIERDGFIRKHFNLPLE